MQIKFAYFSKTLRRSHYDRRSAQSPTSNILAICRFERGVI
jgi:hypothetical protein